MAILPVPEELPGLVRRPGLKTWKVLDNALTDAPHPSASPASPDVAEADNVNGAAGSSSSTGDAVPNAGTSHGKEGHPNNQDKKGARKTWLASLWPPSEDIAREQGLEHSLRLYPHLQDTGAFFVCVLVKAGGDNSSSAPGVDKAEAKRERAASPVAGEPEAKKQRSSTAEPGPTDAVAKESTTAATAVAKVAEVHNKTDPDAAGQKMGAGRPFNEEPYIYLTGLEDEQVKICKCVASLACSERS